MLGARGTNMSQPTNGPAVDLVITIFHGTVCDIAGGAPDAAVHIVDQDTDGASPEELCMCPASNGRAHYHTVWQNGRPCPYRTEHQQQPCQP